MGKIVHFSSFLSGGECVMPAGPHGEAPGQGRRQREGEACVLVSSKEWVRQGKETWDWLVWVVSVGSRALGLS